MIAATRSSPECAASERMPKLPVANPTAIFKVVTAIAATPQKPAAPKAETTGPAAKASEAAQVPPDAPVITIKNVCDNATAEAAKSADCKTVVTRAEFERLLNAVAPQIPANARRQVATKYANLI